MDIFSKIDLSKVGCEQLALPCAALGLRFAKGHEFKGKIRTIFVAQIRNEGSAIHDQRDMGYNQFVQTDTLSSRDMMVVIDDGSTMADSHADAAGELARMPTPIAQSMRLTPGLSVAAAHSRVNYGDSTNLSPADVADCLRLVCTMCLLDNNPDLIEAVPLEKDRQRWEETHDPALIERAARKGLRGWNVGRDIVAAPGYRHPHFAIRWMGRGPDVVKKAVLRPVKGCLVQRGKLLEIPTGYLDDEDSEGRSVGNDVEPAAEAVCS